MIRTINGLLALSIGQQVTDRLGDVWVRDEVERNYQGIDGPYDVLVPLECGVLYYSDAEDLYPAYTQLMEAFGPFEIKED